MLEAGQTELLGEQDFPHLPTPTPTSDPRAAELPASRVPVKHSAFPALLGRGVSGLVLGTWRQCGGGQGGGDALSLMGRKCCSEKLAWRQVLPGVSSLPAPTCVSPGRLSATGAGGVPGSTSGAAGHRGTPRFHWSPQCPHRRAGITRIVPFCR